MKIANSREIGGDGETDFNLSWKAARGDDFVHNPPAVSRIRKTTTHDRVRVNYPAAAANSSAKLHFRNKCLRPLNCNPIKKHVKTRGGSRNKQLGAAK